ncbi:CUB domain-containing protein [Ditylenchus destructor]|uniref:CUB domain-containing protein n=1 Tax=Ditylenchus destructor TaxID=166010 RepID=A0AAD4N4K6_9BILA|nr:CUB domain-containing protein [Ditylenchus destructor]
MNGSMWGSIASSVQKRNGDWVGRTLSNFAGNLRITLVNYSNCKIGFFTMNWPKYYGIGKQQILSKPSFGQAGMFNQQLRSDYHEIYYSDGKPQYRCQDNSGCIPRSSLCDHIQDCADNDDESEENCNGNSKSNVVETKARYGNVYSPGFIVSQGNNFSYSHDARSYEWRITQQPGTRIKLNFMAIDVDPHEDKLLVESMDSGEKFPVAAYKYPTTFLSSGSKIRIKYEPSKKARRKGFHLQYSTEDSSVCVRKFESWNGTFSPPRRIPDTGKYRSATDCVWTIDNFAEETISIRIPYFKLASGDWLAVYDGPIQNETLFANFSSTNQPPSAFLSQATEINFKFWAGPNTPGDEGFQIVFERSCEDQMISSSFGSIESLNFRFKKRKPKKSYSCSWIIDVPCHHTLSNCAFTLFFDYLDLLNVDEINIIEENKEKEVYIRSSVGMPQFVYHSNSSRAVLSIKSMSDTFFSKITFSADCPDPSKVFGAFISTLSARDTFPYRSKVDLTCAGQHRTSSRKSNSAHNQLSTLAHCEASGKWDTTAMLTCKATKSEDICVVPIIENGYPTKLNRDEGELFFECDFGFVNVSLNPTKCINGNWTPEPCCKGE